MRSWFIAKDIGDGPQSLEPERALWASVLHQAIEDLNGRGALTGGEYGDLQRFRAEQRRAALAWILDNTCKQPGSFVWCCGQLGIDPGAAQQRILRADQQRTAGEKKPAAIAETAPAPPPTATVHEIKPKARKAMANNGNHNGHDDIETLKTTARRFAEELAAAEKIVARLKPVVVHLNGAVAALAAQRPSAAPIAKNNGHKDAAKPPRQILPPIPKQPQYAGLSLIEALTAELQKSTEPLHPDELTRAIFAPEHFWRAKQCCTSTLTHGAKSGKWTRLVDGRYTLGAGEGFEPGLAAAR